MRTIKFRGIGIDGKTYYGNFVAIMPMSSFPAIVDEGGYQHEVKPETVAQLVGYDSNGAEVYEGDTLIDAFDNQYEVQFYPMGVNDDDCINLADSAKLNLTLKEDQS